jgi:hypothetical protein
MGLKFNKNRMGPQRARFVPDRLSQIYGNLLDPDKLRTLDAKRNCLADAHIEFVERTQPFREGTLDTRQPSGSRSITTLERCCM